MEAARTSETLVNFYQTTRCYNPEDSNLHTHRRENLKSYFVYWFVYFAALRQIHEFYIPEWEMKTMMNDESEII
jgi:hypothetical protein